VIVTVQGALEDEAWQDCGERGPGKQRGGEPHGDPPQRRGGSGKGAEERSPHAVSEGSEREHLSPGSIPLHPEAGRFSARDTGQVTCSGGGRNCAMRLLLPPRLICSSWSPLCLSVSSLHLLRDRGVQGLLLVLFRDSGAFFPGRAAGRGRRHQKEHPGNGRGGERQQIGIGRGNSGNRQEGAGGTLSRNPGAERITALPGQIGAAAASGVTGGAEGCGRDLGEEGPA